MRSVDEFKRRLDDARLSAFGEDSVRDVEVRGMVEGNSSHQISFLMMTGTRVGFTCRIRDPTPGYESIVRSKKSSAQESVRILV